MHKNLYSLKIIGPLAAIALALTGCTLTEPDTTVSQGAPTTTQSGTNNAGNNEGSTGENQGSTSTRSGNNTAEDQIVSPAEAAQKALTIHTGAKLTEIELEREHGVSVWEIKMVSNEGKWEVSVDVLTGEIVKDETKHADHLEETLGLLAQVKVPYEQALDTMFKEVPEGSLVELEFEHHHGTPAWEGQIMAPNHQKHEILIDAVTGAILEHEIDD